MIYTINIKCGERAVSFKMDLDASQVQDQTILWYMQQGQVPEPEVVHLMTRVLREGDFAVDCGANVGFFTCLMAKLVGEAGRVLSIEPTPATAKKLIDNAIANSGNEAAGVVLVEKVLSDCSMPDSSFYCYADSGSNSVAPETPGDTPIFLPLTTLDFECRPFSCPRLIKMDIEGSEERALRGASKALLACPPFVVVELNIESLMRLGSSPGAIWDFMSGYGYSLFQLHPEGWIPTLISPACKLDITRQNTNVLFSTLDKVAEAWPTVAL